MALGLAIGKTAPGGSVIALRGGLGAGKTTLCKGIAKGLGIDEEVNSPTYTIVGEYRGRLMFYHIDAYRLAGDDDFREIGGCEMLGSKDSLSVIEWSENIPKVVDSDTSVIEISIGEDHSRIFALYGPWLEGLDL
jgi:tRNA threonylcarbamoyladenosine biosynthesis protein TsaE